MTSFMNNYKFTVTYIYLVTFTTLITGHSEYKITLKKCTENKSIKTVYNNLIKDKKLEFQKYFKRTLVTSVVETSTVN